jgi:rfaE bifunctional protein nucleotidyltransferase chain/domain
MPVALTQVINQVLTWQSQKQKVVLVTGVFDLIHIEHLRFLAKAKAAGDKLVVGIESDARVKAIKGHERPINLQTIRQEQLEALKVIDLVFILPEAFSSQADWNEFMRSLHPDVYAVSSHTSYLENKEAICQKYTIDFQIVHQFNPNYSSTQILRRLQASD